MTGPLDGLTAIITGDVEGFSRHQINQLITVLGGKPVSSVSGRTGLVIIGEGAGVSKMHKTRTHGLTVIDADAFVTLALNPEAWDGQPIGEPISAWDARNSDEPEPEPVTVIPFSERHLVGKATSYPTDPSGKIVRQVRMWCSKCGHKWLGESIHAEMVCPVDAYGITPVTEAPWQAHVEAPVHAEQKTRPTAQTEPPATPVAPPRSPEFYEATAPVDEDPYGLWEASLAAVDPETVARPTPAGPLSTDW